MSNKIQLDIDLLLPAIPHEQDGCVDRLQQLAATKRGIEQVHVDHKNGKAVFCVHYDAQWLTLAQVERLMQKAGAQLTRRYQHDTLRIAGMDCASCATSIEDILRRRPGIIDVSVNYAVEKMRVEYDSTQISRRSIIAAVKSLGYVVDGSALQKKWLRRNWQLVLSLSSGACLAAGYFLERTQPAIPAAAVGLYLAAYLTGGYDAFRHGLKAARHLKFDIDFLMIVAAAGAALLGDWAEGALLLFLFSLGHALEHMAMDRARGAIRALANLAPRVARVRLEGREKDVPVETLQIGDLVIVRPGERLPVDGAVAGGHSEIDESPITGESLPRSKGPGDQVFAGTINTHGVLEVEVQKLVQDTTLARIVRMVEEAQTQKGASQRLAQKFTRVFVPAILAGVSCMIVLPPLAGWLSWSEAFLRAMTVLVGASPCALAISTPAAILSGIAQAARHGVLVKGGIHLENLSTLRALALDKTGTITVGRPRVTEVVPLDGFSEAELVEYAASIESHSEHPLARAVVEYAGSRNIPVGEPEGVQSVPGMGVTGRYRSKFLRIGNNKHFDRSVPLPPALAARVSELEQAGKTTMLVQCDGEFIGLLALADVPRAEAEATLEKLRLMGIRRLLMITGDHERVAAAIAAKVGLTEYRASLLPHEKVDAVRTLKEEMRRVAMIGDGINDAPAMATADVGIAMGGAGTDVALETADVALMADALDKLPFIIGLSRQTRRIIMQNLAISLGVILMLVPAALFGLTTIGIAIIFHEGSTLVVVLNALRLLGYRHYA